MFKKLAILMVLLLIAGMMLVSCDQTDTVDEEDPAEGEQPAAEEPLSDKHGGVLRSAHYAPMNLDPAFFSTVADDHVGRQFYDFLVYIGEDNEPDINRGVAEHWESDETLTIWTFELRQGISFHDGKEMTSRDVKHTFDRLRDPDVGSALVGTYSNINDIVAPDDYTVVFELEEPNSELLKDLGDYHAMIVDADLEDYSTTWNGTGAFMVERYEPEDRVVLTRNPNYWMTDSDGLQLPYLDGIEIIFLSESTAQVEALRGGQIDYLIYLPTESIPLIEEDPNLNVLETPSNTAYILRMRSDQGPAADVLVRQALKAATDRSEIIEGALDGFGTAGLDSPIGPSHGDFYIGLPEPERDVEKAKALLAEAGYPDGLEITMHAQDSSPVPAIAIIWKEQLAEAGVELDIQMVPTGVYYSDGLWLEVDFAVTDWGARANPHNYLDLAYVCGGSWNESHFCDPELDELAAQVAREIDYDERVRLYHEIQEIFLERGPIISFFVNNLWGINDKVKGAVPTIGLNTALDLRAVYIEE